LDDDDLAILVEERRRHLSRPEYDLLRQRFQSLVL
jgi:hypothetical protein